MACFGLIGANAGALAMEPLGHIAGTASSLQGLITTVGGALIGFAIGQQFDGTTMPFLIGFTLCGAAALAVAFWANRRRAGTRTTRRKRTSRSLRAGRDDAPGSRPGAQQNRPSTGSGLVDFERSASSRRRPGSQGVKGSVARAGRVAEAAALFTR
jgi:hypothetical protein